MIPDGIYDVRNRNRREWWSGDRMYLFCKAATINRAAARDSNADQMRFPRKPFGHFPDLPEAVAVFDLRTVLESHLKALERRCLCGAPATFRDGQIHLPCGH